MNRVSDLIDRLGGNASVARDLGLKPSAVSEMKRRNSIPPKYWAALIEIGRSRGVEGVSADRLVAIHSAQSEGEVAA